ncbi:MAG: nucleotidyltransferase family protein [Gammaproteobacteria bacterium]|nr:nucleotidyltransferase family protein [Gammaproteobacteria bacterium]MBT7237160.1 nucleotidyltransferase family protein [Gammaproteobacteria bacterium]
MMYKSNNKPTVIILCGGKGLRLRPLTKDIPKPLVQINDKPILDYILNQFIKYKFDKFIIATGYKSTKIEEFMGNNFTSLDYDIVNSGDSDIITRIRDSIKDIDNDFILSYGDTISNIDLTKLIKYHNEDPESVTVTSFPITIPFGVMEVTTDNYVKSFTEKPVLDSVMNIGYFFFTKKYHHLFFNHNSFVDVLSYLAKNKKLKCYKHSGIHITINTIAELEYANKDIKKIYN